MFKRQSSGGWRKTSAMKKLLTIAGVCCVLVALAVVAIAVRFTPSASARRVWKEKAISEVASRVADQAWVGSEVAALKKKAGGDKGDADAWLSDRLILMRNGEWLAYASVCQKENRRIADLFLARGSDGRWYYSTYHFCIGMIVLRMEEQPEDLGSFAKTYYVRSFDGRSDECLQKTWPLKSK